MVHPVILFLLPTLIWGSTWYAITFQLPAAPPELSVFLRFVIASGSAWLVFPRLQKSRKLEASWHWIFAGQGLFMFCLNYILTYHSEKYLVSALVAVVFTLLLYFNMAGQWLFFRIKPEKSTLGASLLGLGGIFLIFKDEVFSFEASRDWLWGLLLAILATLSASAGNMFASAGMRRGIPLLQGMKYSMLYGCLWTFLILLLRGTNFSVQWSWLYVGSLVYLAVPGTLVAFGLYLKLLELRGATQAAYTSVMIPLVALLFSSIFEKLSWDSGLILGALLILSGQLLMIWNQGIRKGASK